MKNIYFFLLLLCSFAIYAQEPFTLNKGKTTQKNYFTAISYKEVKGKIIVKCEINGKPCNFIVDTGASVCISEKLYNELNPEVLTELEVSDQSEKKDSLKIISLKSIKLGDVTFKDVSAMVLKNPLITECFQVDGLLGSNLLRNSVIQFSSNEKKIYLTDNPKQLKLKRKYAEDMELTAKQSHPHIIVYPVNGKIAGKDNPLFDSGMDSFYDLSLSAFEVFQKINLFTIEAQAFGTYTFGLHGMADNQKHYRLFLPELSINNYSFKNLTLETTNDDASRIGTGILKYGKVTLDYRNKKFYFEPYSEEAADVSEKTWPIGPTVSDGELVVGIIWDESLKDKVKLGDKVVKMGNTVYEGMDKCEIMVHERPEMPDTTVIILRDVDTGEIKKVEINKK
jgi:hypothetical protein